MPKNSTPFPVSFDNTAKLKFQCEAGLLEIPEIPIGKESLGGIEINSKVISTGLGPIKAGVEGEVVRRYQQNGYNRYEVKWPWGGKTIEREKDVSLSC